ncbi:hypothetical protein AAC387_Pa02g1194 [Persea americana]
MGILDLLIVSSVSVLKVLIMTSVGSLLATDHVNILGEDARKHLNNVVYFIFNPALVCANLSRTITFESMALLWFMPLNVFISYVIGSALGWLVNQITKAPTNLRGLILGCCAAGNLGTMPLIVIPAICKERGSPFGASAVCQTYGLAYTSLSMAIGAIFLWSYVYNIVRISSIRSIEEVNGSTPIAGSPPETYKLLEDGCSEAIASAKDCSTLGQHAVSSAGSEEVVPKEKVPTSAKLKQLVETLSGSFGLKNLLAPSTIGAIVGFVIGMIPKLRRAFIGESAPFRMIQDSIALLGDGAIPTLTLIMGGNLIKGIRGSGIRVSLIIGIIVVRYIALPLSGIAIIKGAIHFGLLHSDHLYQFVLLLQFAVPPALNIGTITQLFGEGESECSVIFLWSYALAPISLTFWSTVFLWLLS